MKRRAVPAKVDDERILTTAELLQRIPFRRQTVSRMVRENRFPKPIQLGKHKIGWRLSAVLAWIAERETHPLERRVCFGSDDNDPPTTAADKA